MIKIIETFKNANQMQDCQSVQDYPMLKIVKTFKIVPSCQDVHCRLSYIQDSQMFINVHSRYSKIFKIINIVKCSYMFNQDIQNFQDIQDCQDVFPCEHQPPSSHPLQSALNLVPYLHFSKEIDIVHLDAPLTIMNNNKYLTLNDSLK